MKRTRRHRSHWLSSSRARKQLRVVVAAVLLLGALFLSPGNTRPAFAIFAMVAACALFVPGVRGPKLTGAIALAPFVVAVGACAVQLVPLPAAWVGLIAPDTLARYSLANHALGLAEPTWLPLSLSPHTTFAELVKLAGVGVACWVFLLVAARRGGAGSLLTLLVWASGAVGITAMVHYLMGAERLFGFASESKSSVRVLSPLLNPNHFGALMIVGACAALGRGAQSGARWARVRFFVTAFALVVGALLSGSRGVVVMALVALPFTSVGLWLVRNRATVKSGAPERWGQRFVAAAVLATSLWLLVGNDYVDTLANEPMVAEFTASDGRLEQWKHTIDLIADYPIAGTGKGAYEAAFSGYHPLAAYFTFAYAENMPLQALADWGIVLGTVFLLVCLCVFTFGIRRWALSTNHVVAAGACLALLVHSTFDFGAEVLGLLVTLALLLAVLFSETRSTPRSRDRRYAPAIGALLLLLGCAALMLGVRTIREDKAAPRGDSERWEGLRSAIRRHPGEPFLYAAAAAEGHRLGKPEAVTFANAALTLQPTNGTARWVGARLLFEHGKRRQACEQYRLAAKYAESFEPVAEEVYRIFGDGSAPCLPTQRGAPPDPVHHWYGRGPISIELASRRVAEHPDDRDALVYYLRLAHKEKHADAALAALRALEPPWGVHETRLAARVLEASGFEREALAAIEEGLAQGLGASGRLALRLDQAEMLLRAGRAAQAKESLNAAFADAMDARSRAVIHRRLASAEDALGNRNRADWERGRAKELDPSVR